MSNIEIQQEVKDFVSFIEKGYYKKSKKNLLLQERFKKVIKANKKFNLLHSWFHPNSAISYHWLKKQNKNFF